MICGAFNSIPTSLQLNMKAGKVPEKRKILFARAVKEVP
jgi:hypothetical protein